MVRTHTVADIITKSGIQFGTSGARGLVTEFSAGVCAAFTQSFLLHMATQSACKDRISNHAIDRRRVAIGIDNRPSSKAMAQACAGMAQALGLTPVFCGVLPTPALAHFAFREKIPAIMVTGSHIPFDRNGLKFYRPDGEITKADEQQILACDAPLAAFTPTAITVDGAAHTLYLRRYQQFFAPDALAGLHIGIYEHSSAGRDVYRSLFESLGATVTSLARSDVFVPIDTEAVSAEDQAKAHAWAAKYHFDAIFSTDGDGDRPLVADGHGNWLRGDIVGLLTAKLLGINALAVPVNCNSAIELAGCFTKVQRTRIGSPYVIDAFAALAKTYGSVAGFEANGGFLLASTLSTPDGQLAALPTRDAVLPALTVLAHSKGQGVAALFANLPARFTVSDRLQQVPTAWSHAYIAQFHRDPTSFLSSLGYNIDDIAAADCTDGLRLTFTSGEIIHIRPSGNAPELRCYVEASSRAASQQLLATMMQRLQRQLDG